MKSGLKRTISVFLAIFMIVTSIPFTVFADNPDLVSLKEQITAYETKMNGTVYTNMKAAYTAYIKAKEALYAYEAGNNTTVNLKAASDDLATKTDAMKSWSGLNIESPSFNYGNEVPATYARNILYSSVPAVFGGMRVEAFSFKFVMPQNVVFLYDGLDLIVPVMVAVQNNGVAIVGNDRAPLSFFVNDNTSSSLNDNEYFQLNQQWKGYYEIEKEGGPTSANEFNWNKAMEGTDKIPGYNNETNSQTGEGNRGEKILTGNQKIWRQYANWISYQESASDKAWNKRLQTVALSWTGRNVRWTDVLGSTKMDYHYYYGSGDSDNRFSANFYVIDYRGAKEAINSFASTYLNINNKYLQHELDDALDAIEYLQTEPLTEFNNGNYSERAANVAKGIGTSITELSKEVVEKDMSSYATLSSTLSTCKAVYDANNAGDVYTADTYSVFKSAFEASQAEAADVYTNHFTTATTANDLDTAYKNLNAIIKDNGTSRDTSYTYDSTTGTVTITGHGAMGDYISGDQSPFGNSDAITTVVISDGVTNIGENAFNNCRNLRVITVPSSLTYGKGAFDDCPQLETVYITGGEIKNKSRSNAPWNLDSVVDIHLGTDKDDMSVTSIDGAVFRDCDKKAIFVYNTECVIPDATAYTFGTSPTIHGFVPSTAYTYHKNNNTAFISLGHNHSWVLLKVVPETCISSGYTEYKCKYEDVCSATKIGDEKSALGHDLEKIETVIPTCTVNGYDRYKCTRCDYEEKKNYEKATGHNFDGVPDHSECYSDGEIVSENNNPEHKHRIPCTNSGCTNYKEEFCSFIIQNTGSADNFITFECTKCHGTYKIKSQAEPNEFNVFFFGCDNRLIKVVTVEKDHLIDPEQIPALKTGDDAHRYMWDVEPNTVIINQVTAFHEIEIVQKYTVTYHDDFEDVDKGFEEVPYGSKPSNVPILPSDVEQNADPRLGHIIYAWVGDINPADVVITEDVRFHYNKKPVEHNFSDTYIKYPSCTEIGYMSRYCNECGFSIDKVEVQKVDHTPEPIAAVPATCTVKGKTAGVRCKVCKEILTPQKDVDALGHSWDNGKKSSDGKKIIYTCTRKGCGATKTENAPVNPTPSPTKPSADPLAAITPSDKVADAAPVNKSIKRPGKVKTTSLSKKKQMRVRFSAITGAVNYRVMFRKAGEKNWNYAWTEGKTEYYLKNLKKGGLYDFCFAAYKKNAKGQWERGNYSKITRRYYYKHALKKYKGGNGSIKLKWKKKKGATAYQVQYSTKKSMAKAKTITINNPKQTSYTITGLKKGKKYFVRVRVNKKYKKKNFTGEYSKRRKVIA